MKLIRPSVFSESSDVITAFTESNRSKNTEDRTDDDGLDFGLNTASGKGEIESNYKQLLSELDILS